MKKFSNKAVVLMVVALLLVPALAWADGDVPPTDTTGTNGAAEFVPPTSNEGTSGAVSNVSAFEVPPTSTEDTSGAVSNTTTYEVPPTSTENTSGAATAPEVTGSISGGTQTSSGGSTGNTTSNTNGAVNLIYASNLSQVIPTHTETPASLPCPLLGSSIAFGDNNDSGEVAKLQTFLNVHENANLTVSGIYDAHTFEAVKAFQTKYATDIIDPWGASYASGFVYITTMKKINELTCNAPIALTSAQVAIINAYKASLALRNSSQTTVEVGTEPKATTTASLTDVKTNDNVAAVVNADGFFVRIWKTIIQFFGL